MSQQGPILAVSTAGRPSFAASLDEAKMFPVIETNWAEASHAVAQLQPAAVLAAMSEAVQPGFVALAKQFSLDFESGKNGGDLGWVFRGQTDTTFENVAFTLAPNQYSGPVKTDKGYHLIQSLGKEVRPLPVDLVQQRKSEAFANYIKSLRDKAKIEKLLKL